MWAAKSNQRAQWRRLVAEKPRASTALPATNKSQAHRSKFAHADDEPNAHAAAANDAPAKDEQPQKQAPQDADPSDSSGQQQQQLQQQQHKRASCKYGKACYDVKESHRSKYLHDDEPEARDAPVIPPTRTR
jgi:PBZ domain